MPTALWKQGAGLTTRAVSLHYPVNAMSEYETILDAWREGKTEEYKASGYPPELCLLGYVTYASLCGAVAIAYGLSGGELSEFDGCRIYVTRSFEHAMAFGRAPGQHQKGKDDMDAERLLEEIAHELGKRANWWRKTTDDTHHIATAMTVALEECRSAIREAINTFKDTNDDDEP